jgi:hypothetical protein
MEMTKLGMVGAISSLVALPMAADAAAHQAPSVEPAQSYSDLLQPIPNAVEKLKLSDLQDSSASRPALLQKARWVWVGSRRRYRRHHYYYGYSRYYYAPPVYYSYGGWGHHHHHHHHHHHGHY